MRRNAGWSSTGRTSSGAAAGGAGRASSPHSSRTRSRCCCGRRPGWRGPPGSCRSRSRSSSSSSSTPRFAFAQESQAERAVEALRRSCRPTRPSCATASGRSSRPRDLVPGDMLARSRRAIGSRADARLLDGRARGRPLDAHGRVAARLPLRRRSTTSTCRSWRRATSSSAAPPAPAARRARSSFATGMRTELGRIAALSRAGARATRARSSARSAGWPGSSRLIAVVIGVAFVPIAMLGAGLSLSDAVVFADRPARRQRARGAAAGHHAGARGRRARARARRARSSSA